MRLLLDTNIFVYYVQDKDLLSRDVNALLDDYDNQLYMSAESLRELIVGYRNKGLLRKQWDQEYDMIQAIEEDFNIQVLPIKKEHMLTYSRMEINEAQGHKDPSDHVIIAHAMTEGLTLISSDTRFSFYQNQGLQFIWNEK